MTSDEGDGSEIRSLAKLIRHAPPLANMQELRPAAVPQAVMVLP